MNWKEKREVLKLDIHNLIIKHKINFQREIIKDEFEKQIKK